MDHYELINLDEYTQSGEGGTAVSYTHKTRSTLAKLYKPGFEADRARAEFPDYRALPGGDVDHRGFLFIC